MKVTFLLALVLVNLIHVPAFGAQLDAVITQDSQRIEPTFEYFRIVYIDYHNGGQIAESLRGKQSTMSITAEYPQTKGTEIIIEKLNQYLSSKDSTAMVTDVNLEYRAELVGKQNSASIQYNIKMIPTVSELVIPRVQTQDTDKQFPKMVDSTWRGLSVYGPVILDTPEYGKIDINKPNSALQVMASDVHQQISQTDSMTILGQDLINADRIYQTPLDKWHSLFDPTFLQSTSKELGLHGDTVLTRYSLGECNLETGPCADISQRDTFTIHGTEYVIRSIESQDDATITIEGYVSTADIAGLEIFGISKEQPKDTGNPATGEFPVTIIYGMAGLAVIGAGAVFFISSRKLKSEEGKGQGGIDPSLLRAQETTPHLAAIEQTGESHTLPLMKKTPKKVPYDFSVGLICQSRIIESCPKRGLLLEEMSPCLGASF